jgi:hypothetical protein
MEKYENNFTSNYDFDYNLINDRFGNKITGGKRDCISNTWRGGGGYPFTTVSTRPLLVAFCPPFLLSNEYRRFYPGE